MKILFPQEFTLTSSNVADSSFTTWDNTTAYAVGDTSYIPSNYGEYKCLVANTGKDPLTHTYNVTSNPNGEWLFLGTTNKYRMFDKYLNTQSIRNGKIIIELLAYGYKALFLGNLDASTVNITVVDNNTLEIIETFEKKLKRNITSWFDYFYGDWKDNKKNQFFYERTTATRNVSIIIEIDNGVNDAKCGIFCCGDIKKVGITKFGLNIGSLDYSTVATDTATGDTFLAEGNYAKTMDLDLFTKTENAMALDKILNDARGKVVVFVAGYSDDTVIYGYKQKHSTLMNGKIETIITVNIIGLT